ncbi:MAG: polyisoprenyl-phosphate glycosyltransferase [Acetobacteraceae bacterium]|jgi:glycosyltransferase involved in cell wall biosynthesis|nr:polyisoprenyl-phosphate glycosyltransferase [Acetobacteraceae bacterium]
MNMTMYQRIRGRPGPDAAVTTLTPLAAASLASPPVAPKTTPSIAIPTFSVVAPAYNEAENLSEFHAQLSVVMDGLGEPWELVLINDGSRDATLRVMEDLRTVDPRIAIVNLSRNFGKEIATTAGLDHARGAAVILIDADLQDPPAVIPELVAAWREGYDNVYARRRQRQGETWLKQATAAAFYRVLRRATSVPVPADTGDFRLLSRRVVDALLELREQHRFMKGLFAWVGFPSYAVLYDRHPRHAGSSAWNYWKLWNFALEGITSFTTAPLRVATYLGLFVGFAAAVFLVQLVIRTVLFGNEVPGYPSLMAVVLFLGGAQLVTLGSVGEYLGRVFNEVKQRPLYFVERYLPSEPVAPERATDYAIAEVDRAGARVERESPGRPGERRR